MRRVDHNQAQDALNQYLTARTPTGALLQALASTIAQMLANDTSSEVTVQIGRIVTMRRAPASIRTTNG